MTAATQIVGAPTIGGGAPARPRVIGLDLAAERSGIAYPDGTTTAILAPKVKGTRTLADDLARLDHIAEYITDILAHQDVHLAVIEDYAAGIRSAAAHRLAEISGAVRLACWRANVPIALVNVMHLKIYATGSGGATKSQMATSAQARAGLVFPTEDECDAAWLRWLGLDLLSCPGFPLPERNREVLKKIVLPEGVRHDL